MIPPIISFRPAPDVRSLLRKAMNQTGKSKSVLINETLRQYFASLRGKRELQKGEVLL
jgi:hypothetical protein